MTPIAELRALSATDRTERFHMLAQKYYGGSDYAPKLSADLEKNRSTIFAWRRNHTVPLEVIVTLEAWINGPDMAARVVADWESLPGDLAEVLRGMTRVTATLATIARRMPRVSLDAAPGDAFASSSETQADPECQQSSALPA